MRTIALSITLLIATITAVSAQQTLSVTSPAFPANGPIPSKYSCQGVEVSPPLSITNIPAGTKSLALTIHDPDAAKAGGVTHWVIWNLAATGAIPENFKGASQGLNSDGKPGYKGMCPPSGTHHYHFKVYALNTRLSLRPHTDKAALELAVQGHVLAEGELVGLYSKE